MIKTFGRIGEDVCDLAQARSLLNFELRIILVDGQRVHSYDELVRLATSDKYRNREIIEVIILPAVAGG